MIANCQCWSPEAADEREAHHSMEQPPECSIYDTAREWVSIGMDKLGKSNGKLLEAVRNRRSTTNCCLHCFIGLAGSRCCWVSRMKSP
nr:hypothetical protein Itr_chr02CG13950 [Ipomoea trifida]